MIGIFKSILSLFFAIAVFCIHLSVVHAACTASVAPTSGDSNEQFTVTISGCPVANDYRILRVDEDGNEVANAVDVTSDPTTFVLSSFPTEGSYDIEIYDFNINLIGTSQIQIMEITPIQCGDIVQDQSQCPLVCGAILTEGQYQCIGVDPDPYDNVTVPNPDGTWPDLTNNLDCSVGDLKASEDNVQTLSAIACLGGFSSLQDILHPITIQVNCLDTSGLASIPGDQCWTSESRTITPEERLVVPEDRNGDGVTDNYFTCFGINNINRDVGKIDVNFTTINSGSCTTESINTIPTNYDFFQEYLQHLGDQSGYNSGSGINSPLCSDGRINTAIGCVSYDIVEFTKFMLGWSLGVGGGVALVLLFYSGVMMSISMGDPAKLNESKSLLMAAVSGLLLIIFSAFLLRVIGVNILELF